jgi:hypothetical protein
MIDAMWRRAVFLTGDIRRLSHWPFVTWAKDEHLVHYEEILEALPLIRYGDVGLHRDRGYLSNLAIPGFMKHAWIHVQDDQPKQTAEEKLRYFLGGHEIVEAVSEGVLCRSPLYPMRSDYVIVLEPWGRGLTLPIGHGSIALSKGACLKARRMVGQPYDHRFEFNIEEELNYDRSRQTSGPSDAIAAAAMLAYYDLEMAARQFRRYDIAFTCTELVAYAWWHLREQLGIRRTERYGKRVILADSFLNKNWRIRWASESVTVDVAASMGLHEEGVEMVRELRR